jgi:hypothetical protein
MTEQTPKEEQKQEKSIAKYAKGVEALDAVLEGLSASDIDLARAEGAWTIRQIVHHIVDAEDIWETCIKAALGNPGCKIDLNWYIIDNKCAGPLDYAHRPIAEALELFRAIRRHIVEMVKFLPGAWNTPFTAIFSNKPEGFPFTVADVIGFQNLHLLRHIQQIRESRKKHGI